MVTGRGSRVRLAAVLVAVVLALTGFSSSGGGGSGSGGKSKSSGGGGGCSSSKSKSKSKKTHSGGGSGGESSPTASPSPVGMPATAVVLTCVGAGKPSTTVEVTSRLDRAATFEVTLNREGAAGALVETARATVTLEARRTGTLVIALIAAQRAAEVKDCRITSVVEVASSSPSPTATATATEDADDTDGTKRRTKPPTKPTKPRNRS
ncbi:hypothetical protein [Streptomyces sp. Isolate_45]|uniref:hypothetical protein n=1 Tax=Streptomyces sp. Isolate_45 TaxID=2950111 RepID=UPI002481E395|nr:hypothetical protein [Streptomyces sp. Isolate_45]MDA5284223.1 hypothetical protein [Streptomyces sp. Isolate_45]